MHLAQVLLRFIQDPFLLLGFPALVVQKLLISQFQVNEVGHSFANLASDLLLVENLTASILLQRVSGLNDFVLELSFCVLALINLTPRSEVDRMCFCLAQDSPLLIKNHEVALDVHETIRKEALSSERERFTGHNLVARFVLEHLCPSIT